MATFVLVPGAGSSARYWHLLLAELRRRGHGALAVELPCDDDRAGFDQYADAVVAAIADHQAGAPNGDVVVVAHSFGGFTGTLVCDRTTVDRLVLVSAMIPAPGESPEEWWANTGHEQARREQDERDDRAADDEIALFLHDVPAELAVEAMAMGKDQSATPMAEPWPLSAWPDVPTSFLLCRDDKFFPAGFMRAVVAQRLGLVPDEMDAGHHPMLSRPIELADRLESYRTGRD